MNKPSFKRAERKRARLRLAMTGPSGSGKTMAALRIAAGIGGRVAVIDTEHGSASLYSDIAEFDTLELEAPFSPERYVEAIGAAEEAGYDVLVIDSITHEWNGKGGILEIHDRVTRSNPRGNSYTAWADVTPRHNAFIEAILQSRCHVIVTMRSKTDFVLVEKNGKQAPQKVGMAPIQREGFEYEMTVVLDLARDGHFAVASKDRTRLFAGDPQQVTEDTGRQLLAWLDSGAAPATVEEPESDLPEPGEHESWLADQLAHLDTLDERDGIAALQAKVRARCEGQGDRAGYERFIERKRQRLALLAQAPQDEPA